MPIRSHAWLRAARWKIWERSGLPRSPMKTRSSAELAGDVLGEILEQEPGQWHLAALVALGVPERQHAR